MREKGNLTAAFNRAAVICDNHIGDQGVKGFDPPEEVDATAAVDVQMLSSVM